ncbi:hypothetical protein ElyMa_006973300 [Elysia marginata]|uniref:Uncharacterized protein n=1 Tax=Elysia marginata TaxID=1093978 RepID=A0AAV4JMF2_9GAST|nr:hypothetical protein ElyMa_006973300 [Elysia marginata]
MSGNVTVLELLSGLDTLISSGAVLNCAPFTVRNEPNELEQHCMKKQYYNMSRDVGVPWCSCTALGFAGGHGFEPRTRLKNPCGHPAG